MLRRKNKQKGAVAVMMALLLPVLIGFTALAIDIGNLMVARAELQTAADAAALAAAPCLWRRAECGNLTATEPDWATAEQKARDSVALNKVQGVTVQVGEASSGYWNLTGTPYGLQAPPMTPTASDIPAVHIVITKADSNANKAIPTYLAKILGIATMSASAHATAVIVHPGVVGPGGLFPIALSKCLFDTYWDSFNNKPKLATTTDALAGQTVKQVIGEPYKFQVGSSYHAGLCESGQWTTFETTANDVPYVRDLIDGKDVGQGTLEIGETPGTYIQPGTENSLFNYTNQCSADAPLAQRTCEWGIVPVVNSLDPKTNQVVQAFACVHILMAKNGNDPYVLMQMSADTTKCQAKYAGGSGPDYGADIPPRLVQ